MPNSYSCIIVDDEQDAIELLTDSIKHLFKNINITDTYSYWEDALEALKKLDSDLLFMDISMPGKNAIDLLKLVPDLKSEIIFVTAHEQYALDAFTFSTSGYILKPINDVALSAAINKALERVNHKRQANQHAQAIQPLNEKVRIPNNHGIDYVNLSDILYLETVNKCTMIVTNKAEYVSSYQIGKYKDMVGGYPFFHAHRSYIINLNFILRYETSGLVIMTNKKEIPISRNVKNDFLKLFNKK